jgi:hypothetical protein
MRIDQSDSARAMQSKSLKSRLLRSLALVAASAAWFVGTFALAWGVLPGVPLCLDFSCGSTGSDKSPLFGHFVTWPQALVMLAGILGTAILIVAAAYSLMHRSGQGQGDEASRLAKKNDLDP